MKNKSDIKIDSFLLEILCCPECKNNLKLDKNKGILKCVKCRRSYKIRDNIPYMLDDKEIIAKKG